MPRLSPALILLLAVSPARAASADLPALDGVRRWICHYGPRVSEAAWSSLDMAIVDPDSFERPASTGPAALAYVSVGEADERRSFWNSVKGKPYLVEVNPEWKGAHRVDLRAKAWRELLLEKIVPEALAKGYDGVMLDTIDVAAYLESSAPARFAGSVDAAVSLVLSLRSRYPKIKIVMNNGLPLLERVGGAIDGVLVEDLYTHCLPDGKDCTRTPAAVTRDREAALDAFRKKTGKPVFNLIYSRLSGRENRMTRRAVRRSRRKGYRAYLTGPALDRYGEVDP